MSAEFDNYAAAGYGKLLQDPLRRRFAGSRFFFERKLTLLRTRYEQHASATRSASWLDLGCGEGTLLQMGKEYFRDVAGCDVSAGMIQGCEALNVREQVSPRQIPFADESFDLVTAVCVYHHVDIADRPFLTTDVSRVLKPKGLFCVIEHNPFNPIAQFIVWRCPLDVQAHLLTPFEATRLVRSAGMKFLETNYFLYLPERLYGRFSRVEARMSRVPFGGQYALMSQKL